MIIRHRISHGFETYWGPWMNESYLSIHHLRPGYYILETIENADYGDFVHKVWGIGDTIESIANYVVLPDHLNQPEPYPASEFFEESIPQPVALGGTGIDYLPSWQTSGNVVGWETSVSTSNKSGRMEYEIKSDFFPVPEEDWLKDEVEDDEWKEVERRQKKGRGIYNQVRPEYTQADLMMTEEERVFKNEIFRLKNEA